MASPLALLFDFLLVFLRLLELSWTIMAVDDATIAAFKEMLADTIAPIGAGRVLQDREPDGRSP